MCMCSYYFICIRICVCVRDIVSHLKAPYITLIYVVYVIINSANVNR